VRKRTVLTVIQGRRINPRPALASPFLISSSILNKLQVHSLRDTGVSCSRSHPIERPHYRCRLVGLRNPDLRVPDRISSFLEPKSHRDIQTVCRSPFPLIVSANHPLQNRLQTSPLPKRTPNLRRSKRHHPAILHGRPLKASRQHLRRCTACQRSPLFQRRQLGGCVL
jgi:hypothetical protein